MWVRSAGQEDLLKKGTATNSSILSWRIPWTEPKIRGISIHPRHRGVEPFYSGAWSIITGLVVSQSHFLAIPEMLLAI